MECKEKILFDLTDSLEQDCLNGIGVHITSDLYPDFSYRVYHCNGYCFDITKEHQCEPDEIEDFYDIFELQKDGCTYSFYSNWDGFKTLSIDEAIRLIKREGVFS